VKIIGPATRGAIFLRLGVAMRKQVWEVDGKQQIPRFARDDSEI
jgi:hypothetical protein